MELKIRTLTPLWTGGVETGKMDRIHETGIVGSLRWWYEAIIRGLGGEVCNPTADDRCPIKKNGKDAFCSVCDIFGATGQRRKFRVRLGDGESLLANNASNIPIPSGRVHKTRKGYRAGGWYLMSGSVVGQAIPLRVIPLSKTEICSQIRLILSLIHRHAAIGAKVSNGYGVLDFSENGQPVNINPLEALPEDSKPERQHILPDIRDFFFAKFQFEAPAGNPKWWKQISGIAESLEGKVTNGRKQTYVHRNSSDKKLAQSNLNRVVQRGILPIAPAIRNWLRYQWTSGLNDSEMYFLFGESRAACPCCFDTRLKKDIKNRFNKWCSNCKKIFSNDDLLPATASKINVSHAYRLKNGNWEFRIWGWIPCQPPNGIQFNGGRDRFLSQLKGVFNNIPIWREVFNGSVPNPKLVECYARHCDDLNGLDYLKELLGSDEGGTP